MFCLPWSDTFSGPKTCVMVLPVARHLASCAHMSKKNDWRIGSFTRFWTITLISSMYVKNVTPSSLPSFVRTVTFTSPGTGEAKAYLKWSLSSNHRHTLATVGLDMSPWDNQGTKFGGRFAYETFQVWPCLRQKCFIFHLAHVIFLLGLTFRERALQLPLLINKHICSSENEWNEFNSGEKIISNFLRLLLFIPS